MTLETFHSIRGGELAATFADGRLAEVRVAGNLVSPVHAEELAESLVDVIEEGFSRHFATRREQEPPRPGDEEARQLRQFADDALERLEELGGEVATRRRRETAAADPLFPLQTAEGEEVRTTWRGGQLVGMELSHRLLAGPPAALGNAVVDAVNRAAETLAPPAELEQLLAEMTQEMVEESLRTTAARIAQRTRGAFRG